MKPAFFAWLSGLVSAAIFAYLAFRASLLYRKSKRIQDKANNSPPSAARDFFVKYSEWLKLEAGWRPFDHKLIIAAIIALAIHQVLSLIEVLS